MLGNYLEIVHVIVYKVVCSYDINNVNRTE